MSLREFGLRKVILPLGDHLFGQEMIRRLGYLEEAQYFQVEKLKELQLQALRKTLLNAIEVPMYAEMFKTSNFDVVDIKGLEDLARLPIVSKEMLRENFPEKSTRKTRQKPYLISTSGSTGRNLFLYEDRYTAGWYRASFLLAQGWSGWKIGVPHLQTGISVKRGRQQKLKDSLMKCHYFSAYELSDENLDAMLATIEKKKLKFIWGYPVSLSLLSKRAIQLGWNQPLSAASTWGDTLTLAQREIISSAFRTKVFDSYGISEGIQVAAQCEIGSYHLMFHDSITEILDENDQPVVPGEVGRVVLTRLHAGASPLVRYEVGDLAQRATQSTCSCGRTFPLLGGVFGRESDLIYTPDGNRLIVHFFTGIMEHFPGIESFQVRQSCFESILIFIVPDKRNHLDLDQLRLALVAKGTGGLRIDFEITNAIPLSDAGKRKFVISDMK